jgi:hypothetical protein
MLQTERGRRERKDKVREDEKVRDRQRPGLRGV